MNKSLKVLDLRYKPLAELYDNSILRAREISVNLKVNEIPQLTFKLPANNPKIIYLMNEYLVEYEDEYYVIKSPEVERTEEGACYYSYTCTHLSNTLQNNTLNIGEITPKTSIELMKVALAYEGDSPTLGWSVGTVEVSTTVKRGLDISEQSSFSILCAIADKYDGMLQFRSKERKVDLLRLDSNTKPKLNITLRKNLKGLKVKYDSSEMVTRLYCFGAEDSNGNEIDIMSVNPTKKAYIENYSYYYGLGYTDDDIKNNPELFVKTNIWRDSNYTDPADLYSDGIRELERVSKPKVEISITALDTSLIDEYQPITKLNLGDVVIVDDNDLGIKFRCHIIEMKKNEEEPYILNITISNEIDYRNVLSELFSSASTSAQVITEGGKINGSHINGISTDQIRNLDIEYCSIEHLVANYIDAKSIAAKYALITDLNALNIETNKLSANQAEILSLLAGNIGSELIQTIHLTADNVVIDDAVIKDLIASRITANDILSGNIDTRQIHIISSDDGSGINIVDKTMQFVDYNGGTRIQIGEDATGQFSFILTDENGTQIITGEGIKPAAVPDKLIKNQMVDDKAINSRTIDWESSGASIDENGNPIWDTSRLIMNGEKFEVEFNRLKEETQDISTTVENNNKNITETVENNYNKLISMIGSDGIYDIKVVSSAGTIFSEGEEITTQLRCYVYKNGVDISDNIPETNFYWKKYFNNGLEDTEWKNLHSGTRTIYLENAIVDKRNSFVCTVDIPDNL